MRMPRVTYCDCGEDFDIDRSTPCKKCKKHYCERCLKGDKCKHCEETPMTNKTQEKVKLNSEELLARLRTAIVISLPKKVAADAIKDVERLAETARKETIKEIKSKLGGQKSHIFDKYTDDLDESYLAGMDNGYNNCITEINSILNNL